jgi:hypothetical protein
MVCNSQISQRTNRHDSYVAFVRFWEIAIKFCWTLFSVHDFFVLFVEREKMFYLLVVFFLVAAKSVFVEKVISEFVNLLAEKCCRCTLISLKFTSYYHWEIPFQLFIMLYQNSLTYQDILNNILYRSVSFAAENTHNFFVVFFC